MKRIILFLSLITLFTACSREKIFTEIDYSFKKLEDVFPANFKGHILELYDEKPDYAEDAKKYRRGLYGATVALEAIEAHDPGEAGELWHSFVDRKKSEDLAMMRERSSGNLSFEYKTPEGFAGRIWTSSSYMFSAEAESQETLESFLLESKLAGKK